MGESACLDERQGYVEGALVVSERLCDFFNTREACMNMGDSGVKLE